MEDAKSLESNTPLDEMFETFAAHGWLPPADMRRLIHLAMAGRRALGIVSVSLTHWLTDEGTPAWLKQQMVNTETAIEAGLNPPVATRDGNMT